MSEYAAFLRGINVGRAHRVSSAELRECFEELGLREVSTFRSSGNVAFAAGRERGAELCARIEKGLESSLGYEVAVFLRSAGEVRAIAAQDPFPAAAVEASRGKLQVAMLSRKPTAKARRAVLALATEEDRLAFGEQELFWLPSAGTQESRLDFKPIDKLLGRTTVRTMGTVEQMAAKYFGA